MPVPLQDASTLSIIVDWATLATVIGSTIGMGATLERVRRASDSIARLSAEVADLQRHVARLEGQLDRR